MKNYFLLGRGELFLLLIDEAKDILDIPPASNAEKGTFLFLVNAHFPDFFFIIIAIDQAFTEAHDKVLGETTYNTSSSSSRGHKARIRLFLSPDVGSDDETEDNGNNNWQLGWNRLSLQYPIPSGGGLEMLFTPSAMAT